ncbi:MAG TPA: hypothetical protein VK619_18175 [Pyrinomonadaceae bacterium]|nr:hypothetical protein [Pyrinomonadaceae bacterium]
MKRYFILALACLILCPALAAAQTRNRTATGNPQRRTRNSTSATPNDDVRAGAQRVAAQIKSLAQFLYLYGPISRELASNEAAAQGNPSQTVQQNKAKLQDAFKNYKTRMDELETMFSGSSDLRRFYPRLLGIADDAATAEEQVATGRYDQGGRYLLEVLSRLTDVLADMR